MKDINVARGRGEQECRWTKREEFQDKREREEALSVYKKPQSNFNVACSFNVASINLM